MKTLGLFNSIRWRLQIWYGLILVAVVTGLGIAGYQLEQSSQFQKIEEELRHRVFVLANALPRGPRGERGPSDGPRGEFGQRRPPPDRPPPDGPPPGGFPGDPRGGPPGLHLKSDEAGLFESSGPNPFYYVFWFRDGEEIEHSSSTPDNIRRPEPSAKGGVAPIRKRSEFWETYHYTPRCECLLVGRSVAPDLASLRHKSWYLSAVGAGVLALGLAGGGWIAKRAIQPIDDISASAVKIASGDLSYRINISDTDTELGRLAGVLNSTFERLDAAFSQQTRFTSDAAHELRAPIAQILSQALPHIFERFYRADISLDDAGGGTGLSLAISKSIVAAHGGSIEVSNNSDAGATFTVRLPMEPDSQE